MKVKDYFVSFQFVNNGSCCFGDYTCSTSGKINAETLENIKKIIKELLEREKVICDKIVILSITCLSDL